MSVECLEVIKYIIDIILCQFLHESNVKDLNNTFFKWILKIFSNFYIIIMQDWKKVARCFILKNILL